MAEKSECFLSVTYFIIICLALTIFCEIALLGMYVFDIDKLRELYEKSTRYSAHGGKSC